MPQKKTIVHKRLKQKRLHKKIAQRRRMLAEIEDHLPQNWKKILFKHKPKYENKKAWFWYDVFNKRSSDEELTSALIQIYKKELK